jgi:hypothetical protein
MKDMLQKNKMNVKSLTWRASMAKDARHGSGKKQHFRLR